MPGLAIALLLFAAPAQPADTWKGSLCAHDAAKNQLVGSSTYYTRDAAKVWIVGPDALKPVDQSKLIEARARPFYINNEAVILNGQKFEKYGLPRVLSADELNPKPYGLHNGVPFYSERGLAADKIEVIYLLSRAVGCEFQPYYKAR